MLRLIVALGMVLAVSLPALAGGYGYSYYPSYTYYQPNYNYTWTYYPAEGYWPAGLYAHTTAGWLYKPTYSAPAVSALTYSANWRSEYLKLVEKRDDLAAFETARASLGNYASNYTLNYGAVGYGHSNYATPFVGHYGVNGNTAYGYTFNSLAQAYGSTDMNVLYQQASRLAQGAQQLGGQATTDFQGLVQAAGLNQARVAEILARGASASQVLKATEPQQSASVQQTIIGNGGGVQQPNVVGPQLPQQQDQAVVQQAQQFLQTIAVPQCGSCHGANNPKGGFNVLSIPQMDASGLKKVLKRLVSTRPDFVMPRNSAGVGQRLSDEQLARWIDFLTQ